MADQKLVRVHEVAARMSCSIETVRRMLRAGQIPGVKIGGGKDWRVDLHAAVLALSRQDQPKR